MTQRPRAARFPHPVSRYYPIYKDTVRTPQHWPRAPISGSRTFQPHRSVRRLLRTFRADNADAASHEKLLTDSTVSRVATATTGLRLEEQEGGGVQIPELDNPLARGASQWRWRTMPLFITWLIKSAETRRTPAIVCAREANGIVLGPAIFGARQTDHQRGRRYLLASEADRDQRL